MSAFNVSYILLWCVVCVLLLGVVGLYSAFGLIYGPNASRPRGSGTSPTIGPAIGEMVSPPDTLIDLTGKPVDATASASRWLFVSMTCQPCLGLREALIEIGSDGLPGATIVICSGKQDAVSRWGRDLPDWLQLVNDEDGKLFEVFKVTATPLYVGIVGGRCVVSGPASDRRGLNRKEELLLDHLPSSVVPVRSDSLALARHDR
jgi:hypothetical protein